MTLQRQAIFWALAAAALIAFIYVFSSVLLPFVAGMAIAYLLDPAADWFERLGFSRLWATLSITALAIIIVVIGLLLLVPLLVEQLIGLVEALRPYIPETLRTILGLRTRISAPSTRLWRRRARMTWRSGRLWSQPR
jgi:predicted PurR-regulated permease PerM